MDETYIITFKINFRIDIKILLLLNKRIEILKIILTLDKEVDSLNSRYNLLHLLLLFSFSSSSFSPPNSTAIS